MDFKEATDRLIRPASLDTIAEALGVSRALVRQARLTPSSRAHRKPPESWRRAVIRIAEVQVQERRQLIADLLREESQ